jgi:Zn-dependent peptidase ImmA (M78 family)/DNA-binding XRE family transcriptional regulator
MANSVPALVNPTLLIWAREKTGLSQEEIAKKISVKVEKIASWEQGTVKPTIRQARMLAHQYKRPLALFYLSTPPMDFKPMLHDFRILPGREHHAFTSNLGFEIRRAIERRNIALELLELCDLDIPQFAFLAPESRQTSLFAVSMRQFIEVKVEEQLQWKSSYQALNAWREVIEKKGILIFQASRVDIAEMRGVTVNERPLPVILLNASDSPNGRIFTMIHELTHILLEQSGICDLKEDGIGIPEDRDMEIFCNRVAGEFLLPTENLLAEHPVQIKQGQQWTDDELSSIAHKYNISREVVLRRLLVLGKTTSSFYSKKAEEFRMEFLRMKTKNEKPGFALPHTLALSHSGSFFANLVLESYYKERITASDVSEYLDVKLRHLTKIEEVLAAKHLVGA